MNLVPYTVNDAERYDGYYNTCLQTIKSHLSEIIFKEAEILKSIQMILSISKTVSKRSLFDFFFGPGTGEIRQK